MTTGIMAESATVAARSMMLTLLWLALHSHVTFAQLPELRAVHQYDSSDHVGRIAAAAAYKHGAFAGLLIDEGLVTELYPVLPFIFFDEGSSAIPSRYHTLDDPARTGSFDESALPGDMLGKYHHLLNIIGYRMRLHPDTRITLRGYCSMQGDLGETTTLSSQRAESVYRYLTDIWKIYPSRIKLLPGGEYPPERSNPKDMSGRQENRRVEIGSDNWEIAKPILVRELCYRPWPASTRFLISNGMDNNLVARRSIEIRRGGEIWHTLENIGRSDTITLPFRWGEDSPPLSPDERPLAAQLVIRHADGSEHRSPELPIPVRLVTIESKKIEWMLDIDTEIGTFIRFNFNSAEPGLLNNRILQEYFYHSIREGARIRVTGRSDVTGFGGNSRLTRQRTDAIANAIARNVKKGLIDSIRSEALGEQDPLYSSEHPEGRFYARSVRVVIETPFQRRR